MNTHIPLETNMSSLYDSSITKFYLQLYWNTFLEIHAELFSLMQSWFTLTSPVVVSVIVWHIPMMSAWQHHSSNCLSM